MGFCDSEEDLIAFGVADATSVAKYFGLRSEILGVDYSSYDNMPAVNAGEVYVQADTTDPDICVIEEAYIDLDRQIIGVTVTAQDYDSPMRYYSYSIDGGITYTPYLAWPETDIMAGYSPDTFTFEIPVPDSVSPAIIVRGINQYDRYSASNLLSGFPVFVSTPEEIFNPEDDMLTEEASVSGQDVSENSPAAGFTRPEPKAPRETDTSFLDFLKLCLLAAGVLFVAMLITNLMIAKKRRQKRKPPRRR